MRLANIGDSEKLNERRAKGWIAKNLSEVRRASLTNCDLRLLRHKGHPCERYILTPACDAFSRLGGGFHVGAEAAERLKLSDPPRKGPKRSRIQFKAGVRVTLLEALRCKARLAARACVFEDTRPQAGALHGVPLPADGAPASPTKVRPPPAPRCRHRPLPRTRVRTLPSSRRPPNVCHYGYLQARAECLLCR